MKKIILALTLASFGAVAFAQSSDTAALPAVSTGSNYILGAKFAYEGKYVSNGQRHSTSNIQTNINFEYLLPAQGVLDSLNLYTQLFYMSPITKNYNEASLTLGTKGTFSSEYFFDAGYRFTGYPNSSGERVESAIEMNRGELNRKNEVYLGVGRDVQLVQDWDWSQLRLSAYATYNFSQEQLIFEFAVEKKFESVGVDELDLNIKAAYGYSNSNEWEGDQVLGDVHYDYGYFAASADAIYNINESTALSFGVRYAYNNGADQENYGGHSNFWCGAAITFRY